MVPHEPGEAPGSKAPRCKDLRLEGLTGRASGARSASRPCCGPSEGMPRSPDVRAPEDRPASGGVRWIAASGLSHQPFEIRVRQHRKFSVTAGTFRGCLVVKDFAILARADGQRVFDLAAAIMWAGQCDIATMLREVHSHEAYASLVKTVVRTEEGRYPRAMAPCTSVRDCISSRRVAPRSTRPPSL
jgi:hypothetical protein